MYDKFVSLVDEEKKVKIIDPSEEYSSILEFKTFWLLCILTFKNNDAKEYLFKDLKICSFIETKSEKYLNLVNNIIAAKKGGFPEGRITAIGKNIMKFFEFIYYLIISDVEKIIQFKNQPNSYFNKLLNLVEKNRMSLLLATDQFDVFNWMKRIYKDCDRDLYD